MQKDNLTSTLGLGGRLFIAIHIGIILSYFGLWAITATAAVDTSTMTTERRMIGPSSRLKSRNGNEIAPPYNSGGMKIRKRTSGSSVTRGVPGTSASRRPPTTSIVAYGIL